MLGFQGFRSSIVQGFRVPGFQGLGFQGFRVWDSSGGRRPSMATWQAWIIASRPPPTGGRIDPQGSITIGPSWITDQTRGSRVKPYTVIRYPDRCPGRYPDRYPDLNHPHQYEDEIQSRGGWVQQVLIMEDPIRISTPGQGPAVAYLVRYRQ